MFKRLMCFLFILGLCTPCAQSRPYYAGPRGSLLWHEDPGMGNPVNVGALAGVQVLRTSVGSLYLETDFGICLKAGQVEQSGGEWEIQWLRLHAAYRSPGKVFLKAKLGVTVAWFTVPSYGASMDEHDFGGGGGAGIGWRFARQGTLELEYEPLAGITLENGIDGRVDMITFQVVYWFGTS